LAWNLLRDNEPIISVKSITGSLKTEKQAKMVGQVDKNQVYVMEKDFGAYIKIMA
jgi:hypothetical protein